MGLTIHWHHEMAKGASKKQIKEMLGSVKQFAERLGFAEVGDIVHLKQSEISAIAEERGHPFNWFIIQSEMSFEHELSDKRCCWYRIPPKEIIGISLWPGEGCEEMNVIFGLYPGFIEISEEPKGHPDSWMRSQPEKRRKRTGLAGRWLNSSFCKTTYSVDPVKCHIMVCSVLRMLEQYMEVQEVNDESGYYDQLERDSLAESFASDHRMLAAFAGAFKDSLAGTGLGVEAPITQDPEFERLEFEGQDQLGGTIEAIKDILSEKEQRGPQLN